MGDPSYREVLWAASCSVLPIREGSNGRSIDVRGFVDEITDFWKGKAAFRDETSDFVEDGIAIDKAVAAIPSEMDEVVWGCHRKGFIPQLCDSS